MEETLQIHPPGRPGRRKGSGKRAGAEGAWGLRAVQALADSSRWRIVLELERGSRSLGELAGLVGLSAACTSHHVSILKQSELVETRREARALRISVPDAGSRARRLLDLLAAGPANVSLLSNRVTLSGYDPRMAVRPRTAAPELEASMPRSRRSSGIDIEEHLP